MRVGFRSPAPRPRSTGPVRLTVPGQSTGLGRWTEDRGRGTDSLAALGPPLSLL